MADQEYNKTFLQADTLEEAKEQLQEVYEANPDAVIIVEEEGKECIIEHGKQLNFLPSTINPQELAVKDDIQSIKIYTKDEFTNLEEKEPNTIYIVTK